MKKELTAKRKALRRNYADFLNEVLHFIQMQNVSKYAYYRFRDEVIEKIYDGQEEGTTPEHIFKHGYEAYFARKTKNAPKKTWPEATLSFSFVFFTLFFVLEIMVYGLHFIPSFQSEAYYSKGMNLFVTMDNLALMTTYGFVGVFVSIFFIRGDKKRRNIQLVIAAAMAVVMIGLFVLIGRFTSDAVGINIIVLSVIFLGLAAAGYFLEDFVSRRKCEAWLKSKEGQDNGDR